MASWNQRATSTAAGCGARRLTCSKAARHSDRCWIVWYLRCGSLYLAKSACETALPSPAAPTPRHARSHETARSTVFCDLTTKLSPEPAERDHRLGRVVGAHATECAAAY